MLNSGTRAGKYMGNVRTLFHRQIEKSEGNEIEFGNDLKKKDKNEKMKMLEKSLGIEIGGKAAASPSCITKTMDSIHTHGTVVAQQRNVQCHFP